MSNSERNSNVSRLHDRYYITNIFCGILLQSTISLYINKSEHFRRIYSAFLRRRVTLILHVLQLEVCGLSPMSPRGNFSFYRKHKGKENPLGKTDSVGLSANYRVAYWRAATDVINKGRFAKWA